MVIISSKGCDLVCREDSTISKRRLQFGLSDIHYCSDVASRQCCVARDHCKSTLLDGARKCFHNFLDPIMWLWPLPYQLFQLLGSLHFFAVTGLFDRDSIRGDRLYLLTASPKRSILCRAVGFLCAWYSSSCFDTGPAVEYCVSSRHLVPDEDTWLSYGQIESVRTDGFTVKLALVETFPLSFIVRIQVESPDGIFIHTITFTRGWMPDSSSYYADEPVMSRRIHGIFVHV